MMTVYSRTLLVVASLFCLMFSAVRSDAQDADLTLDEQVLAAQERLDPLMLAADTWAGTWKELMKPRTWRNASEDHEIKARFIRFDPLNNKVILKNSEGKEIPVAISKLSENDRRILGNIAKKQQELLNVLPIVAVQFKDLAKAFFDIAKHAQQLEQVVGSDQAVAQGGGTVAPSNPLAADDGMPIVTKNRLDALLSEYVGKQVKMLDCSFGGVSRNSYSVWPEEMRGGHDKWVQFWINDSNNDFFNYCFVSKEKFAEFLLSLKDGEKLNLQGKVVEYRRNDFWLIVTNIEKLK